MDINIKRIVKWYLIIFVVALAFNQGDILRAGMGALGAIVLITVFRIFVGIDKNSTWGGY